MKTAPPTPKQAGALYRLSQNSNGVLIIEFPIATIRGLVDRKFAKYRKDRALITDSGRAWLEANRE